MAIYSCNLRSIGRTTHAAGTAGAFLRYIARPEADPELLAGHMPSDPKAARAWMDEQERGDRKNARVIDKIRIALPRELNAQQRADLVREFMADLTGGRVPWYAAIHQSGQDAHNPHVHIALRDRDIETGKRVLRLSDNAKDRTKAGLPGPKAVDWVRGRWEAVCNRALAQAGHAARIDRRTLEAQGIDRAPAIHIGPGAARVEEGVARPKSRPRVNGAGRRIDYPSIDQGRTRKERHGEIVAFNLEKAARSGNPETAAWALFEKEQRRKDRDLENRLAREARARTAALRALGAGFRDREKELRKDWKDERGEVRKALQARFRARREEVRTRQRAEREELKDRQSRLRARLLAMIDITGTTRRKQEAVRKALSAAHKAERRAVTENARAALKAGLQESAARHRPALSALSAQRKLERDWLRQQHREQERQDDLQRQQREAERDSESQAMDKTLREQRAAAKESEDRQDPLQAKAPPLREEWQGGFGKSGWSGGFGREAPGRGFGRGDDGAERDAGRERGRGRGGPSRD